MAEMSYERPVNKLNGLCGDGRSTVCGGGWDQVRIADLALQNHVHQGYHFFVQKQTSDLKAGLKQTGAKQTETEANLIIIGGVLD